MAAHSTWKLIPLRRTLSRALKPLSVPSPCSISTQDSLISPQQHATASLLQSSPLLLSKFSHCSIGYHRYYSSAIEGSLGPAAIDYLSVMQEDEYHKLANSTIHNLLQKLEEYGDSVEIDGYDVDYGNEVLTLKLGSLGTYVINKQTPNRQIWMSSPVSGPSRFDWDQHSRAWIYRRTGQDLIKVLETELLQLCGEPVHLS
ncbi:frataxin, mitochondrial isoform X1 [Henckelia pumila]|uniref:frataxin, mitochondrial isoform X1 n=1 Tax=Henckelia pumila TaxID=405737 RepID=UPI003C6DF920